MEVTLAKYLSFVFYWLVACVSCFAIQDTKIFGHRGGIRGLVPESSLLSFSIGAQSNADYLELDVVSSKDGELIVMHDIVLDNMTDIHDHPEFADRKQTFNFSCTEQNPNLPSRYHCYKNADAFYIFNFTAQELATLKLRARAPYFNASNPLNDQFEILTFRTFLHLVNNLSLALNRPIGITPELKSAALFRSLGLALEHKYMQLLYETGFVHKNHGFYETNYFRKNDEPDAWPKLIVQSDSPTALAVIGDLSNNSYSPDDVKEHVPLQFGIYTEDTLDWRLLNWANTFCNGMNIPWTYVDRYYDLIKNNKNVSINVYFRLENFVPGDFRYSNQYTRNQYFKAMSYQSLYGLDAMFSDNVQDLQSIISMLREFSNASSVIYAQKSDLIDADAVLQGLGIQLNEAKNCDVLLGFVVGLIILYIVTVIIFLWIVRRRRNTENYSNLEPLEATNFIHNK
eukprot:70194_1